MNKTLIQKASAYLNTLCKEIDNRSVGSPGNVKATDFFEKTVSLFRWDIAKDELDVMDWIPGTVTSTVNGESLASKASSYSNGCEVTAELIAVSNTDELEAADIKSKAVLLYGDIAREQLMPKNFVFYNPDSHTRIVALLEDKNPAAIICATGRNSALAGGAYPFPLIEDGDFNIPSVYMTDIEGERLLKFIGETVTLQSTASRIDSKAYKLTASKGDTGLKRIIISAHIDAKKGTPGAIDNATGVVILMLLSELLTDYTGKYRIELMPFNGEDYYAVPGQMDFIRKNQGKFGEITLNINIDGAGYFEGDTAFSFYGVPESIHRFIMDEIKKHDDVSEGPEWPQGDHSIFFQNNVPAVAVSSKWFTDNMENQDITHTEKDRPEIVDINKTVQVAVILSEIVNRIR